MDNDTTYSCSRPRPNHTIWCARAGTHAPAHANTGWHAHTQKDTYTGHTPADECTRAHTARTHWPTSTPRRGTPVHTHARKHTHPHARTHYTIIHPHAHARTRTHARARTHTHTRTHARKHTHARTARTRTQQIKQARLLVRFSLGGRRPWDKFSELAWTYRLL